MSTSMRRKLALAGLSTLVSLGLAFAIYSARDRSRGGDEDIENEAAKAGVVSDLLAERRGDGEATRESPPGVLLRDVIPRADAELLFPPIQRERYVYDEVCNFRFRANKRVDVVFEEHPAGGYSVGTNSAGFLKDAELLVDPELRVLVTGDSHTAGVCDNSENLTAVLEASLREQHAGRAIEVLNAGCGFYTFYQYLGVLERCLVLEPDVFVVVVFGGNDFLEVCRLRHYFQRTERQKPDLDYWSRLKAFHRAVDGAGPWMSQGLSQLFYFAEMPEEERLALEATELAVKEIVELCRANDITPVFAYVPPMWDVQLERYDPEFPRLREEIGLGERGLAGAEPCAQVLSRVLDDLDVPLADLRPAFRAADEKLYWDTDQHINVRAHALVAESLMPLVEPAARAVLETR